jgi:exonuclease VII small subunit
MALVKLCGSKLAEAEQKIEILTRDASGGESAKTASV